MITRRNVGHKNNLEEVLLGMLAMPAKETQQALYEWIFATLAIIAVLLAIHEYWPYSPVM